MEQLFERENVKRSLSFCLIAFGVFCYKNWKLLKLFVSLQPKRNSNTAPGCSPGGKGSKTFQVSNTAPDCISGGKGSKQHAGGVPRSGASRSLLRE